MHLRFNDQSNWLPECFPVGAKYVVEARAAEDGDLQVLSRYVVLPSGQLINVPPDVGQVSPPRVASSRRHRGGRGGRSSRKVQPVAVRKKNLRPAGTAR
jgi:hypothetical protein